VPLTWTPWNFPSHVEVVPDDRNGLARTSYALVEQLRAVSDQRIVETNGNVGPAVGRQVLEILAMITGM